LSADPGLENRLGGVDPFELTTKPCPFPCTLRLFIRLLSGQRIATLPCVSGVLFVQASWGFMQLGASGHDYRISPSRGPFKPSLEAVMPAKRADFRG